MVRQSRKLAGEGSAGGGAGDAARATAGARAHPAPAQPAGYTFPLQPPAA